MSLKMMIRCAAVVIAGVEMFASIAASAATQSRFDLICTGTNMHIDAAASPSYVTDTTPISMRLSIDLRAKRWCYRDAHCSPRLPISSIEGDKLHLIAVKTELNEANFDVDRSTGAYSRRLYTPQYPQPMLSSGTCAMAPFTPIN
jgi:hypothetical protein